MHQVPITNIADLQKYIKDLNESFLKKKTTKAEPFSPLGFLKKRKEKIKATDNFHKMPLFGVDGIKKMKTKGQK